MSELTNLTMQISKVEVARSNVSTNHILHLILTLITGGLWVVIWIIAGVSSNNQRSYCDRRLHLLRAERDALRDELMMGVKREELQS